MQTFDLYIRQYAFAILHDELDWDQISREDRYLVEVCITHTIYPPSTFPTVQGVSECSLFIPSIVPILSFHGANKIVKGLYMLKYTGSKTFVIINGEVVEVKQQYLASASFFSLSA